VRKSLDRPVLFSGHGGVSCFLKLLRSYHVILLSANAQTLGVDCLTNPSDNTMAVIEDKDDESNQVVLKSIACFILASVEEPVLSVVVDEGHDT
jgi:hypothetical protein